VSQEPNEEFNEDIIDVPTIGMDQVMNHVAAAADVIFVTDEITDQNASEICRALLHIEDRNTELNIFKPIRMFINSPGGSIYAAWMVCDIMDMMQTPIHTFGLGQVASGGLIIFMNGNYGYRYATKNTQFLSHNFSAAMAGTHADMIQHSKELPRIYKRLVDHYMKCTGLDKKSIEEHLVLEHDVLLSATDCKKYKIVDTIIQPKQQRHITDFEESNGRRKRRKKSTDE
jgi:ATP-dependent Clp protease protease subunit